MKGHIGKGTECFKFFADFFKYVSEFYIVESNESYWEQLMYQGDDLANKYKNCDFYQFAKALILAYNVYLSDVKYKQQREGHWMVTFRGE